MLWAEAIEICRSQSSITVYIVTLYIHRRMNASHHAAIDITVGVNFMEDSRLKKSFHSYLF
jgi:hypothetical protein